MTFPTRDRVEAEILRQTLARGAGSSICPSEVARALAEDWRPLLTTVREAAVALLQAQRVEILRKGKPVSPEDVRGVIRLRHVA